ncbi:MAG: YsnF/AvaK domain-containing protein [Paenibacillus sp.]|nr:YsnF/AvaK domain-containing protein [Paenibacillus sp.]
MNKKIVGVFQTEHEASEAIQELKQHGFQADDISVVARNKKDVNAISEETGTKAPEGMASGAATGGFLGGLTGLLAGIGALAIPGIGPIIAAGPIAAALAGAAVGAGTGGLVGGLIGLGIPEDEATSYDKHVEEGRILVMVDADNSKESEIYSVFRRHNSANADRYADNNNEGGLLDTTSDKVSNTMSATGNAVSGTMDAAGDAISGTMYAARDTVANTVDAAFNGSGLEGRNDTGLDTMNARAGMSTTEFATLDDVYKPGMTGAIDADTVAIVDTEVDVVDRDLDEDRKLRLREEQLDVSKNKVQMGEVTVHKDIIEEQQTINVPVTREEVVIERHAINDDPTAESIGVDETIRIPVSEERVEVHKNTVITGEVEVHKRSYQETEQVKDTVKHEEARIDKTGNVIVSDSDEIIKD